MVADSKAIKNTVIEHINSLEERHESHYSRSDKRIQCFRKYAGSVSEIHALYLSWMDENHRAAKKASLVEYEDILDAHRISVMML